MSNINTADASGAKQLGANTVAAEPPVAAPPLPAPSMWALDRFVVVSLMEDLHLTEVVSPHAWTGAAGSAGAGGDSTVDPQGGDDDESPVQNDRDEAQQQGGGSVLSAGSATDDADEPKSRARARLAALQSLPALASRLGMRWASAELVPYLLRCVQEDEAELTRAVALILPALVHRDHHSPARDAAVLLDPATLLPVMVALCGTSDAATRHLCVRHAMPTVLFGVSLVTPSSLWDVHSPISAPTIFRETTTSTPAGSAPPPASSPNAGGGSVAFDDGIRSTLFKDIVWPMRSAQSDVPPRWTDAFDRALAIANVMDAIHRFTKDAQDDSTAAGGGRDGGLGQSVALLGDLLASLAASPLPLVAAARVEWISLLVHVLVHAMTAAHSTECWSRHPTTELQLRQSIAYLVTVHVFGCFRADKRFGDRPTTALLWLMQFLPSSVASPRRGLLAVPIEVPFEDTATHSVGRPRLLFDRDATALESTGAIAMVRALPHLLDAVSFLRDEGITRAAPRGTEVFPALMTLSSICGGLEQALVQRQLRVGGDAASARFREDLQSYSQRHDDSFAGTAFAHFHAVTDALEGLLKRLGRLMAQAPSSHSVSADAMHRVMNVVRLYFQRGTNFSQWKNRFFTLRRAGHIVDVLTRVVHQVLCALPATEVQARALLLEDTMTLLHTELLGRWYPQLCGDAEVEVRCAVAHHVVDPLLSIAWLLVNASRAGCRIDVAVDGAASNASPASVADAISKRLFRAAQDVVACTQVCVMDVNDRVRASAAASISRALSLQAYGRAGISTNRWAAIAATVESRKLTDALIALVMDLFRDESHLVLLSVMETFGEVCLHQDPVEADDSSVALLQDGEGDNEGSPLLHDATGKNQQQQPSVQDIVLGNMEQELVALCRSLQASPTWRVREAYAALVSKLTGSFLRQMTHFAATLSGQVRRPSKGPLQTNGNNNTRRLHDLLHSTLLPMLVDVLFDPVRAVRDAATTAVVADLRLASASIGSERITEFVNDTLWPLIRDSKRGNATYLMRSSMIFMAVRLAVDFDQYVLPLLDQLSHDPVVNVRLVVARTVQQFLLLKKGITPVADDSSAATTTTIGAYHMSHAQKSQLLLPLLRGLVEDASEDVRECASKALAACV